MGNMISINGVPAYEVPPQQDCRGGLLVVHEVWGLTEHIKDVAERFAGEGYHVIAPDLLSDSEISKHATAQMQKDLFNPQKRNAIQPQLRALMAPLQTPEFAENVTQQLKTCFDYLYAADDTQHQVGITGFCFGGSYSYTLALHEPRLKAAVPFYGHCDAPVDQLRRVVCPILAFYGEQDQRLIEALPSLEERMHEASLDFTLEVYGDAGHAFFNDSNEYAYNAHAAKDAWKKTLDFLAQNMAKPQESTTQHLIL